MKIDPKDEVAILSVRVPASLAQGVAEVIRQEEARSPGARFSQSDVVRMALTEFLQKRGIA